MLPEVWGSPFIVLVEEAEKEGRGEAVVTVPPPKAIKEGRVLDEIAPELAGRSEAGKGGWIRYVCRDLVHDVHRKMRCSIIVLHWSFPARRRRRRRRVLATSCLPVCRRVRGEDERKVTPP